MDDIPLAEMLMGLRAELDRAQWEGEGKALRFRLEAIDLELQFTATREGEGGGGFKFWVVNAETKGKIASESVQKLHLKLNPITVDPETGEPLGPAQISGKKKANPAEPAELAEPAEKDAEN